MLSRREGLIGIAAAVMLSALAGDRFIITPVMEKLGQLEDRKQQLLSEVNDAHSLFDRRRLMERKWQQLSTEGLNSESEAESRVLHAIGSWASESRLTLTSVKPQRPSAVRKGLQEMTFSVASTGSLEAVARFIWLLEKASLPIKITDVQLGSAGESGSEMSLQIRLSALYISASQSASGDEDDQNG
ncbi:MAG TPA: hypothetical protein VMX13_05785 [Sedimentisphaerales bacterium]|nr:hypothetical protein [Sedimentisphaerales bacterium]